MSQTCIFSTVGLCKSDNTASRSFCTLGPQRIETIINASKLYGHGELQRQLEELGWRDDVYVHKSCVSTYTSKQHISRHLKRKGDTTADAYVSPKRRRRSGTPTFEFREHCLFCGETCDVTKDVKHP